MFFETNIEYNYTQKLTLYTTKLSALKMSRSFYGFLFICFIDNQKLNYVSTSENKMYIFLIQTIQHVQVYK